MLKKWVRIIYQLVKFEYQEGFFDFMKYDFIFLLYMGKVLGDFLIFVKFYIENYGNSFILLFNVEEDSICE